MVPGSWGVRVQRFRGPRPEARGASARGLRWGQEVAACGIQSAAWLTEYMASSAARIVASVAGPSTVKLRVVAFLVLALSLQLSPFAVQVMSAPRRPLVMGWRMFHQVGSDICRVRIESEAPNGLRVRVPLRDVTTAKRLTNVETVRTAARKQCSLVAAGSKVLLSVECGHSRQGWVTHSDGEEDLCKSR